MNYALVEDGVVTNVIWLYPANASDFPSAVPMGDVPATIGDTWDGEHFYRNGERVLTFAEQVQKDTEDMRSALEVIARWLTDGEVFRRSSYFTRSNGCGNEDPY